MTEEKINEIVDKVRWNVAIRDSDIPSLRQVLDDAIREAVAELEQRLSASQAEVAKMQKHRDDWRGYAYGLKDKPQDFLDGNMVDPRPPTFLEVNAIKLHEEYQRAEQLSSRLERVTPYLQHKLGCPARNSHYDVATNRTKEFPCKCGLDSALSEGAKPKSLLHKPNDPLPEGCYCQPGKCAAPVIMGRQMSCRDPERAARTTSEGAKPAKEGE